MNSTYVSIDKIIISECYGEILLINNQDIYIGGKFVYSHKKQNISDIFLLGTHNTLVALTEMGVITISCEAGYDGDIDLDDKITMTTHNDDISRSYYPAQENNHELPT